MVGALIDNPLYLYWQGQQSKYPTFQYSPEISVHANKHMDLKAKELEFISPEST